MNSFKLFLYIFVLSLSPFLVSDSEASLNNGDYEPSDVTRLDPSAGISFSVVLNANNDNDEGLVSFVAIFGDPDGSWTGEVVLECGADVADCEGTGDDLDGTWKTPVSLTALDTVSATGAEVIFYNFEAIMDSGNEYMWSAGPVSTDPGIRVNTVPVLTDDASVSGGGMPEDTYTLTITYTDADAHAGIVSAKACDASNNCETPFSLSTDDFDPTDGAVYSADFTTELGGDITVTLSASDSYDNSVDRTTTFNIDTEKPWLKYPSVTPTHAGIDQDITFQIVYCVFDYEGTGTPTVNVSIGEINKTLDYVEDDFGDCNGIVYRLEDRDIPWSNTTYSVIFSASNDNATAENVSGPDIVINNAPIFVWDSNSAERHSNGIDFVFNITAREFNADEGDTINVYVLIEADIEREMTCAPEDDVYDKICTLTVAEADIINQLGGSRMVYFKVRDSWDATTTDDLGDTIDVTRTSSFDWVVPSDASFQPGLNGYDFEITNNGNSEDTFTVTAVSDNGWIASGSESQTVTVAKGVTEIFTITMDVAHVAAGIVDYWSVSVTAGNDDTQTASHDGETTVAVISGVSVTIENSSGSALPGESVSYYFVITNTGNDEESFAYSTSSQNGWGFGGGVGHTALLAMGSSETVAVLHIVQEGVMAGDSDAINLNAGSGFPGGDSATATTTAEQFYDIMINLENSNQPSTLNPGDSFAIYYAVTNTGNGFDTVTVSFLGDWVSGTNNTNLSLDSGATGLAIVFITIPVETPSNFTSSILALAASDIDIGTTNTTSLYELKVNPQARLVSLSGASSYIFNEGESGEGSVKVNNEGTVTTTFVVTSISDSLNFANTSITLEPGSSGNMFFTIYANATEGDNSFTISDTIDGFSYTLILTVETRVFSTPIWSYNIENCFDSNVICSFDSDGGWDGYRYTLAGTWSTDMTVTDVWGLSGDKTFNTTIANTAPLIPILSAPIDTVAKSTQSFSFVVPTDTDGTITQYVIDFGDGNSVTFESAYLDGRSAFAVDHTYAAAGDYTVSATAYDNFGDSTTHRIQISVADYIIKINGNNFRFHLVAILFMFALGSLITASSFSIHRSDVPEILDEFDALLMEGIDNQEIRNAVKNLNSFQGIPMFSNSIDEYKELLSDSKELKSTIINKMIELGEIREEIYKMQDAGMSVKDLESVVHKLELQLAEQVEADTSVKYLETLQNKFVEEQEK